MAGPGTDWLDMAGVDCSGSVQHGLFRQARRGEVPQGPVGRGKAGKARRREVWLVQAGNKRS